MSGVRDATRLFHDLFVHVDTNMKTIVFFGGGDKNLYLVLRLKYAKTLKNMFFDVGKTSKTLKLVAPLARALCGCILKGGRSGQGGHPRRRIHSSFADV